MNSSRLELQTTLLTSHKGVDLHVASALAVMQARLDGGEELQALFRCELHTFWGDGAGWSMKQLLNTGRFYNPNKHHFGVFAMATDARCWQTALKATSALPVGWPGEVLDADCPGRDAVDVSGLDSLLGGAVPAGCAAFDVVGFARGQEGPVLAGVVWRLVIRGDRRKAAAVGQKLAVARHRKEGLLINPHMENWLVVADPSGT